MRKAQRNYPLELDDLKEAFLNSSDDAVYYLHRETGNIELITPDIRWQVDALLEEHNYELEAIEAAIDEMDSWERDILKAAVRIELGEAADYLQIPVRPTYEDYNEMKMFIETVENDLLREKLADALQGEGAFRHFKEVLQTDEDELERWYAFKDERLTERVINWLKEEEIELPE